MNTSFTRTIASRAGLTVKRLNPFSPTADRAWLEINIETARRDALRAAADALTFFMGGVELTSEGQIAARTGSAYLVLQNPTLPFREAAYSVSLIHHRVIGRRAREYALMDFQIPHGHPAHASADAQELFCFTAGLILQEAFPLEHWILVLEPQVELQAYRWLFA